MLLTIISPTSSKTININWLEVFTPKGSFIIQPGHAPLIALLSPKQEMTAEIEDGSINLMPIAGGILQVDRNQITILITHE